MKNYLENTEQNKFELKRLGEKRKNQIIQELLENQ